MENDFRALDLNLLVVFNVLMRVRNVSKAAAIMYLGQPAISNSLAKLRSLLADELFIRAGGEMVPTPRALEIYQKINPALASIHSAIFEPNTFDPKSSDRIFTIGMRDWVEAWLMPLLLEKLEKFAPNIRIRVEVADDNLATTLFEDNKIDFAITDTIEGPKWLKHLKLASMNYVAVYDPNFLKFQEKLSLVEFTSVPHLMTSTKGDFVSTVDKLLDKQGISRNVIYTSTRFNGLPHILQQIGAIATIPEPLASNWVNIYGLRKSILPFELDKFDLTLSFHEKNSNDQAFSWMKGLISDITAVR